MQTLYKPKSWIFANYSWSMESLHEANASHKDLEKNLKIKKIHLLVNDFVINKKYF